MCYSDVTVCSIIVDLHMNVFNSFLRETVTNIHPTPTLKLTFYFSNNTVELRVWKPALHGYHTAFIWDSDSSRFSVHNIVFTVPFYVLHCILWAINKSFSSKSNISTKCLLFKVYTTSILFNRYILWATNKLYNFIGNISRKCLLFKVRVFRYTYVYLRMHIYRCWLVWPLFGL